MPGTTDSVALMVIAVIVIACSAVAAVAVAAWLVYQIARRAIEKTTPEGVPSVILALASLIDPFHRFLPWSGRAPISEAPAGDSDGASGQDGDEDRSAFPGGGQA